MADETSESQSNSAVPESGGPGAERLEPKAGPPAGPPGPDTRGRGGHRPDRGRRGSAGGRGSHGGEGGGGPEGGQGGDRQGARGGFRPGRGRRDAGQGAEEGGLEEVVVKVYRCATVVKGGRRFSFAALVVVGDRQGRVGVGYGKANEVPNAVDKARKAAQRNMITVKLDGTTIPHRVLAKYGASKVVLLPASKGTGVIAGASVRAVMELAGIKDVLTKVYGSTGPKNLVKAAFDGLAVLRRKEEVAKLRNVSLA